MTRRGWARWVSLTAMLWLGGIIFAGDWPQLQHDPQRSGYTEERLVPPFTVAWTRNFQPERVAGFVQPVVAGGKVFVGTEAGNFYALDALTGRQLWKHGCGSPIMHTAACARERVYFAALNGVVYALNAGTGEVVWQRTGRPGYGFSAAPLLVESRLFIGGRDGTFYALDLSDGNVLWEYQAEEPIFNTAAASKDGVVFVGAEDMRVRALAGDTGKVLWTSEALNGQTMMNTHPVVAGQTILIRPMMNHLVRMMSWKPDFTPTWDRTDFSRRYEEARQLGVLEGAVPPRLRALQDEVEKYFQDHPEEQDLFMLEAATGRRLPVAPHFRVNSMHGPVAPPALTRDGSVVIPWTYLNHGWARMDLRTRRVVEFLVPPRPTNADETLNVSVAANLVFIFHCEEANANYTGIYDLEKKEWVPFPEPQNRWGEMADNLQPASHAVSIAGGHFYHIVFHQLAAWKAARQNGGGQP